MDSPDRARARDRSPSADEDSEWNGFSDEAVTDTEAEEVLSDAESEAVAEDEVLPNAED